MAFPEARQPSPFAPRKETDPLLPPTALAAAESKDGEISDESTQSTGQAILSLAVPALGALLIDPLMNLIDTGFVGRYADTSDQLAGMGSAAALLTFSFYLFNFLCTATTPLVASRRSAGNEDGAVAIGGQALSLAIVLGFTLSVVLVAASQPLLQFMGTSMTGDAANGYATSFLTIRAFAAPAVFVISASSGVLRGYLDTATPIYILFSANVINILLDILLIVHMGLGPLGAGIATTTAEWISAIAFLLILAGKLPSAEGKLGSNLIVVPISVTPTLSMPPWVAIQPLLVASTSVLLRSLVLQLSLTGAAAMVARSGDNASASVAAHQVSIQLFLLCSFICDALAAASQGLVADAFGRDSKEDARDISKTVFVYSLILGIVLSALLWIGDSSSFLLNFATTDAGTQEQLQKVLGILIVAQPLNSLVFAADGVLQGASEFTFQAKAMALSAGTAWCFYALIQGTGTTDDSLQHVWWTLFVLQGMRGVTSLCKLVETEGPINLMGTK